VLKRDVIDYRFLAKEQIINHYCKAGSFTTKVSDCCKAGSCNTKVCNYCKAGSFTTKVSDCCKAGSCTTKVSNYYKAGSLTTKVSNYYKAGSLTAKVSNYYKAGSLTTKVSNYYKAGSLTSKVNDICLLLIKSMFFVSNLLRNQNYILYLGICSFVLTYILFKRNSYIYLAIIKGLSQFMMKYLGKVCC